MDKPQSLSGKKHTVRKEPKNLFDGLWKFIGAIPLVLPAALAGFGITALSLVLLGQFRTEFIWPLGSAVSLVAIWLVYRYGGNVERPGSSRERRWCDVLVILGVLVWVGVNVGYTSQHIFNDRDPAAYSVTGAWLARHDNLDIKTTSVFGDSQELRSGSSGFYTLKGEDRIYPHGTHVLPAMLGAAGKVVRDVDIFKLNVVFGGVALLSFYAFARLFIRPRWSLVAVGVMALSLPMLYFSRDMYTESLMATFIFGSLALLLTAQKGGHRILWLLAGALAGAAVATRIDASVNIVALILFAIIVLALSKGRDRRKNVLNISLLTIGVAVVSTVGLLDALILSPAYYMGHVKYLSQVFYLIVAMLLLGAVVVSVAWRTKLLDKLDAATKGWRGPAIFAFVILAAIALASRPLWFVDYGGAQFEIVPELQSAAGQPVEPRTYAEQTINWLVWYIGLPAVVLGIIGFAVVAARIVSGRNLFLTAGVLVIGSTAFLYLISPTITPDQIWASRRFLPVVMPGLAILAAYTLDKISGRFLKFWPRGRALSVGLALVVLAAPLLISWPFLRHSEKTQYASIMQVCDLLPDNAAMLWIGKARLEAVQPTRTFCGVPSMGYVKDSDFYDAVSGAKVLAEAAASAREQGYVPIVGVYGSQAVLIPESEHKVLVNVDFSYSTLERTLDRPPRKVVPINNSILLAAIAPDGSLVPISNFYK